MKNIGGKNIELTENEYAYYEHLSEKLSDPEKKINGADYFGGLFETDEKGYVVQIKPEKSVPWAVIFFMQQLMINQRLRMVEMLGEKLKEKEKTICDLEKRMEVLEKKLQTG